MILKDANCTIKTELMYLTDNIFTKQTPKYYEVRK